MILSTFGLRAGDPLTEELVELSTKVLSQAKSALSRIY